MLAVRALPRWLAALTLAAGLGQLAAVAVPALDSLQLVFLAWLLTMSGWLLARGARTPAVLVGGPPSQAVARA